MNRPQLLFVTKFFAILIAAYLLVAWNPVNDRVIEPFTASLSRIAGATLDAMGQQVSVDGTVIRSTRFAVNVRNGCNAVEAMLILLASMLAFPAMPLYRLGGLIVGAIVVQLVNMIRIVTLYLLGAWWPSAFNVAHTAVWQIVIILAAIGFFLAWSARAAPTRLASRR